MKYKCNKCNEFHTEDKFYKNFLINRNFTCKKCGKELRKLRYNPEVEIPQVKKYKSKHKKEVKEWNKNYYDEHKEYFAEYSKKYREKHKKEKGV